MCVGGGAGNGHDLDMMYQKFKYCINYYIKLRGIYIYLVQPDLKILNTIIYQAQFFIDI